MNDYGTMCGSKKKHMYLSHCLHKLLQFYRPQSRLGQLGRWLCVRYHFFFSLFLLWKMLFHRGCCQNKSIALNMEWTTAYSIKGRVCGFRGTPHPSPPCQLALGWPCAPILLPSGLSSDGTTESVCGGWAVHPWRINQKALLVRVFSSMFVSLFTQIHSRNTSAAWVS